MSKLLVAVKRVLATSTSNPVCEAYGELAGGEGDAQFLRAKIGTARFYADHLLSQVPGLRHTVQHGAPGVMALAEEQF